MFDPENPYNNNRWRKERAAFLKINPFCVYCKQQGKIKVADVVDHIRPHKGDERLFWNQDNWQALCFTCHNAAKASEESKGIAPGCGADGLPLDKNHFWNQ